MRRRTALISSAAVVIAGAGAGLGIWLSQPSYDDIVKGCEKALAAQMKANGHGKPAACKDVKSGDYPTLVENAVIGHLGWTDSDGNFDENKMLDSVTQTP